MIKRDLYNLILTRTRRSLVRTGIVVFAFSAFLSLNAMLIHLHYLTNHVVRSMELNLTQSILFGDRYQSARQAEGIVNGGVFSSAWIVDRDFDFLVSLSGNAALSFDNIRMKLYSSSFFIDRKGLEFDLYSKHTLRDSSKRVVGYIVVEFPIPVSLLLGTTIICELVFLSIAFIILYISRRLSVEISLPILRFTRALDNLKESDFVDIHHFKVDSYEEVYLLAIKFNSLLTRLRTAKQKEANLARQAAIASTTQMLAHDVRKPFSMMKLTLEMIQNAKNMSSVKEVLSFSVPDIERALKSVTGMLQDVMEIGAEGKLISVDVSPKSLIENAIFDSFKVCPEEEVSLTYDLRHKNCVSVDANKVSRVFANIVGNALQAIRGKADLWFKTRETASSAGIPLVEFCIGNSGSFIDEESRGKLFEAFFTKDKAGGTGLGLAIAHKIVTAHGGRIWCESSKSAQFPKGKVEFIFELPRAAAPCSFSKLLPAHSKEILESFEVTSSHCEETDLVSPEIIERAEASLREFLQTKERPLSVLIVDDEAVYRNAIDSLLKTPTDHSHMVALIQAQNANEALDTALIENPDVFILDVDLGESSLSGMQLCTELRGQGYKGQICIHSNRTSAEDMQIALASGADFFFPKPMTRIHLLRILQNAADTRLKMSRADSLTQIASEATLEPDLPALQRHDGEDCQLVVL